MLRHRTGGRELSAVGHFDMYPSKIHLLTLEQDVGGNDDECRIFHVDIRRNIPGKLRDWGLDTQSRSLRWPLKAQQHKLAVELAGHHSAMAL